MRSWLVFAMAFGAVMLHAWLNRGGSRYWYLNGIVPLVYGATVAGMFMGRDFVLSFQIIVYGAIIPITLLLFFWVTQSNRRARKSAPPEELHHPSGQ